MSATENAALGPVEKSIVVGTDVERAFRRFTREIGQWWPLESHSVGGARAVAAVLEEGVGGRVHERLEDGTEHEWGRILTWEPPHRFVMTWHPGRAPSTAQELEVRFSAEPGGGTRLDLTHRGWERLGEEAAEGRRPYGPGWDAVLARFEAGAERQAAS